MNAIQRAAMLAIDDHEELGQLFQLMPKRQLFELGDAAERLQLAVLDELRKREAGGRHAVLPGE